METVKLLDILIKDRKDLEEERDKIQALAKDMRVNGQTKAPMYNMHVLKLHRIAGELLTIDKIISLINWEDYALDVDEDEVETTKVRVEMDLSSYWGYLDAVEAELKHAKFMLNKVTEDGNKSRMELYAREVAHWEERYTSLTNSKELIKND